MSIVSSQALKRIGMAFYGTVATGVSVDSYHEQHRQYRWIYGTRNIPGPTDTFDWTVTSMWCGAVWPMWVPYYGSRLMDACAVCTTEDQKKNPKPTAQCKPLT